MTAQRTPPRWRGRLARAAAALAVVALGLRLGFWQLDRAAQKEALQSRREARAALPPVDARSLPTHGDGADVWDRRATLVGRWRGDATVALDNRPLHGRPGFYVVTPLELDDGRTVAVLRGWVPRDAHDRRALPPLDVPGGRHAVTGRIAPPPSSLWSFGAASAPAAASETAASDDGRIRQNLDLDAWSRAHRLSATMRWTLRQTEASSAVETAWPSTATPPAAIRTPPLGLPPPDTDGLWRQWPAPATGLEKHRGYAFQWFALAATMAALSIWFGIVVPWRQRRLSPPTTPR